MNALVRKEVRVIAPAWGVALVAMAAGPTGFGAFSIDTHPLCLMTFWLAMTLLGLSSFGREFSSGAFSALLAQPIARERLWRVKSRWVSVAGASLFGLSLFLWADLSAPRSADADWGMFLAGTAVGLAMLTGGLWTTLLFRQVTAAFWITLLIPGALALGVAQLTEWLTAWHEPTMQNATLNPQSIIPLAVTAILIPYSTAGYWWARRLFLRAQDVGWAAAERPLLGVGCWFKARPRPVGELTHRPLRALAIKEFQLHSLSLFFAVGVLMLHLAAIGVRKFGEQSGGLREAANLIWALWFILPFIVGAEAVASERQLGTMEGQLCLPARRRTQFVLKLFFILAAGVILGGVMPVFLENLAIRCGAGTDALGKFHTTYSYWLPCGGAFLLLWFGAAAGLALISCYASSLTRTTLQAMGGAFVGVMVIWAIIGLGSRGGVKSYLWQLSLFHVIGGPSLAVTLIGLSYWNFRRLHQAGQLWRRNLAVLGVWLAFTVVVTQLVYHRAWELVLPLEPQHGPARIQTSGQASVSRVDRSSPLLFVVRLPDGRLWAGTEGDITRGGDFRLTAGGFLPGSNWTALAATHWQAVAIKAGGSLWDIGRHWPPAMQGEHHLVAALKPPQQIGTDSDWESVSASGGHFLALKRDGSLWGWGENWYNQLGEGPKQFGTSPVRIGQDSDWTTIFTSPLGSAALKRDGSLWKWGCLYQLADGTSLKKSINQAVPVRWNLPGTNLVALHSDAYYDIGLYADGSVQGVGLLRKDLLLADDINPRGPIHVWEHSPIRLGEPERWSGISGCDIVAALKQDGSLWKQYDLFGQYAGGPGRLTRIGSQSDWIAASIEDAAPEWKVVALAADGTLNCWVCTPQSYRASALLRPTRSPLWAHLGFLQTVCLS